MIGFDISESPSSRRHAEGVDLQLGRTKGGKAKREGEKPIALLDCSPTEAHTLRHRRAAGSMLRAFRRLIPAARKAKHGEVRVI